MYELPKFIELSNIQVASLRRSAQLYTRSLTQVYFLSPVICFGLAGVISWIFNLDFSASNWGTVQVASGLFLAGWALPLFEGGAKVEMLLTYSGNSQVPELTSRFGYHNIKSSFYAIETFLIFIGTIRAGFNF